jgi:signal transduction histidine kinase
MVDHIPTIYELPLLRMIQEGLNNIRQHASASTVLVQLAVEDGGDVTLTLQDNGRGFDPGLVRSVEKYRHYGLRQMRERIVELNGTLDIYSVSGEGTTLFIRLPRIQTIAAGASNG